MWQYKNGLPPINKPTLGEPVELREKDTIYETGIDGFPYFIATPTLLKHINKFVIAGQSGLYSLKSFDTNSKTLTAKVDKTLNINDRFTTDVKEHFKAWGMKKEAELVKTNYRLGALEFNIDGKLSKGQTVQVGGLTLKIADLQKSEDKVIDILIDIVHHDIMIPIFPYVANGNVVDWYYDMKDVWIRQAKENLK